MNGIIKRKPTGLCFIKADGLDKDLFFHSKALVGVTFDELQEGDAVRLTPKTPQRDERGQRPARLISRYNFSPLFGNKGRVFVAFFDGHIKIMDTNKEGKMPERHGCTGKCCACTNQNCPVRIRITKAVARRAAKQGRPAPAADRRPRNDAAITTIAVNRCPGSAQ